MSEQLQQIEQWLIQRGEPPYRLKQIREAWYRWPTWERATNLSKPLRQALAKEFPWLAVTAKKILRSPADGTRKALLTFSDGQQIETVLMPNARDQWTVCLSTQVGCGMACTFCATGAMGFKRNLTVDEIVDQVRFWRIEEPRLTISNLVFMGMGEPLANYDAVKQALNILIHDMKIGPTRMTLSTVGVSRGLERLLHDETFPPVRVAISIHAGTDKTRARIVPTHRATSMKNIQQWIAAYLVSHGNRRHYITLEYVMLWGVNDLPEEARALAKWFRPLSHGVKLNLIPWNPTAGAPLRTSSQERLDAFQKMMEGAGITTTIRTSKGLDISAACGQLAIRAHLKNSFPAISDAH
jgi:23S rRNA (adenine2503-C2)-methyltransferase